MRTAIPKCHNRWKTWRGNNQGFLDFESAREHIGISVSYWATLQDIANWKANTDHLFAQQKGISDWYKWYKVRICVVEREYEFKK